MGGGGARAGGGGDNGLLPVFPVRSHSFGIVATNALYKEVARKKSVFTFRTTCEVKTYS